MATDAYVKSLTKKIEIEADPSAGKFLPCEALGTVLMRHGEELGPESVYGMYISAPRGEKYASFHRQPLIGALHL